MSGLELVAVVGCVAATVSAFHDGSQLIQQIKAKRRARKAVQYYHEQQQATTTQDTVELEMSLARGPDVIQSRYNYDVQRLGPRFERGDQIAINALKDIIIHLQMQVITNLKVAWQEDMTIDSTALLDVSEISQAKAVVTLMELCQRITMAGPMPAAPMRPPPYGPDAVGYDVYPSNPATIPRRGVPPITTTTTQTTPPYVAGTNAGKQRTEKKSSGFKMSFFGRQKSNSSASERNSIDSESLVSKGVRSSISSTNSSSGWTGLTVPDIDDQNQMYNSPQSTLGIDPESPEFDNPWAPKGYQAPQQSMASPQGSINTRPSSSSTNAQVSIISRKPASSLEVVTKTGPLLPCEENHFAGFCKGAWKLQVGMKKALGQSSRPSGMYNTTFFWRCQKCSFEGKMSGSGRNKAYDNRIYNVGGIQFRWLFLAKTHISQSEKAMLRDPMKCSFGCIFCCAEGRGTTVYGGVNTLMNHMQQHRDYRPTGEVLYRVKCITGRIASPEEDFDINLSPRSAIDNNKEIVVW